MVKTPRRYRYFTSRVEEKQSGQALVIILFVTTIVVLLITQITALSLSTVGLSNQYYDGLILLTKAEGFLENAALRYLRNPSYNGESLHNNGIDCTIEIADIVGGKDLVCWCSKDAKTRKVGMTVSFNQGVFNFSKVEERE